MKKTKKHSVLFCIHTLSGGGAEKLLIDILHRIDYDVMDVDLCVLSREGGIYFDAIPVSVQCFVYAESRSFPPKEYDVEVAFLEGLATKFIALHKSDALKIAWVHIDLYTYHLTKRFYKDILEESMCYAIMDQIVFVSKTAMKQFEKRFPQINNQKKVIYNPIDRHEIILKSQADECPFTKSKLTLCSIGRLVHQKGFIRLIPILSRLKKDGFDFHYLIIGDGNERATIQHLIEKSDLKDTVFLVGFQKNPYPWLKASDIFVSVSFAEGFPLVVGEALCLGKPVLATDASGVDEFLKHGKYGMLVEMDDVSIYKGLKEMMNSESLRASYAQKAEKRSTSVIFSIEKNMNAIKELLCHTVSVKTPLNRMVDKLFIENYTNNDLGLLNGKIGKAICVFHYYAFTNNSLYEKYAIELLKEVIRSIHAGTSVNYESGLAGIGVGIEYLVQHKFIDGNTNIFLNGFDNRMYEAICIEPVTDFSLLKGYMGYARYWISRLFNAENNSDHRETLISQSLDKILSVIDAQIEAINTDAEKREIFRFLHDVKQHSAYNQRATKYMEKYFDANYIKNNDEV